MRTTFRFLVLCGLTLLSPALTRAAGCAEAELAASRAFTGHGFLYGIGVGDFNGDSNADVAVVSSSSNVVSVALGRGDGTFGTNVDYTTIADAESLIVTDLNGDGKPDLVVASAVLGNTAVLLGNGDGTFQTNVNLAAFGGYSLAIGDLNGDGTNDVVVGGNGGLSWTLGAGNLVFGTNSGAVLGETATALAIGDVNADGKPDIVVGGSSSGVTGHLFVLLGNGDGTFQAPTGTVAQTDNTGVAIGDFNNDGTNDVAVLDNVSGLVTIFLSRGGGVLQIHDFKLTGNAGPIVSSIRAVDVNHDGKLDVIVGDYQAFVFLGNGDGTLQPAVKYNQPIIKVEAADFNNDGKLDLIGGSNNLDGLPNLRLLLGNGDGTFQEAPHYATGQGPLSVVAGDFNGDGKPDLAVANAFADSISILLNNGDGTFGTNVSYAAGSAPQSIAVGDFNKDSKLDLIVANQNSSNILFYAGNGDGTFQSPTVAGSVLLGSFAVVPGNFTSDSNLDFAALTILGVMVFPGNGNGTFHAPGAPAGSPSLLSRMATGDFNKDNKLDVVYTYYGSNIVGVLLGNGSGGFGTNVTYHAGTNAQSVAVGDVNGDGKLDLVVGNFGDSSALPHGSVSVLLGNGNGTFQNAVSYPVAPAASIVAVGLADVNGDGHPDIIATSGIQSFLYVLLNNGNGTFQTATPFGLQPNAFADLVVADFNGDGAPDIAVADQTANCVSLLLNTCPGAMGGGGGGTGTVACVVSPALATNTVNQLQHLVATVTSNSLPLAGVTVDFLVASGPNMAASGADSTAANGQAAFDYTGGATTGTDTILATGTVGGQAFTGTATVVWSSAPPVDHDLTVVSIKAPKKVTLVTGKPTKPGKLAIAIQNVGAVTETIPDLATLQNLVDLQITSLGGCAAPVAMVVSPTVFPVVLAPKKKLTISYSVAITCANDPLATTKTVDHSDYRYTVALNLDALDGETDAHPANDDCPRGPNGPDKGCGNKNPLTKQLGADVTTDVVQK